MDDEGATEEEVFTSALLDGVELGEGGSVDDMDRTVLALPPLDDMVGEWVEGRYEITRIIGEGGVAIVYEAEDHEAGGHVALKVQREDVPKQFIERFRQEIQINSRIADHPRVVQTLGSGALPKGQLYLVEELLLGRTLSEALDDEGPFGLERSFGVLLDILEGLQQVHGIGVVHRDLKPDNIFIGPDGRAKVLDCGFAVEPALMETRLTQVGTAVGTPTYMAPEQFLEGKPDASTDLYALGAVAYRMLAGKPPFDGDDPAPTRVKVMGAANRIGWFHMHIEPKPIPGLRADAWGLIARLLAKHQEERFQTAEEVMVNLRAMKAPERVPVPAPTPEAPPAEATPSQAAPWQPSPWLVAALLGGVLFGLWVVR